MARRRIPERTRRAVLDRDGWGCQIRDPGCQAPHPGDLAGLGPHQVHVDHIVPYALGGASDPDNLRASCRSCNTGRKGKPGGRRKAPNPGHCEIYPELGA